MQSSGIEVVWEMVKRKGRRNRTTNDATHQDREIGTTLFGSPVPLVPSSVLGEGVASEGLVGLNMQAIEGVFHGPSLSLPSSLEQKELQSHLLASECHCILEWTREEEALMRNSNLVRA